jgi:pentatricopeptide repeat protein
MSAVLPLLARTRQWETAVELVELMPRHGHVPLFLPQSLFSSLLLSSRSLARVVAGGW